MPILVWNQKCLYTERRKKTPKTKPNQHSPAAVQLSSGEILDCCPFTLSPWWWSFIASVSKTSALAGWGCPGPSERRRCLAACSRRRGPLWTWGSRAEAAGHCLVSLASGAGVKTVAWRLGVRSSRSGDSLVVVSPTQVRWRLAGVLCDLGSAKGNLSIFEGFDLEVGLYTFYEVVVEELVKCLIFSGLRGICPNIGLHWSKCRAFRTCQFI